MMLMGVAAGYDGNPRPAPERVLHLSLDNRGIVSGHGFSRADGGGQNDGFSRCGGQSGVKAPMHTKPFAARLKPCPDTKLLGRYCKARNWTSTPGCPAEDIVKVSARGGVGILLAPHRRARFLMAHSRTIRAGRRQAA
jgi:hypothetical protein